jgi:hypothetical protein
MAGEWGTVTIGSIAGLGGQYGPYNPASQQSVQQQLMQQQYMNAILGTKIETKVSGNTANQGGSMLEKLRKIGYTIEQLAAVDELVELAAYGRGLAAEYKEQDIPAPKWLDENLVLLYREIKVRWRAEREAQLRKAEKELEELRSREEKRAAKEEEVNRLREELA